MTDIATLGLRVDGTANIDSATSSLDRFSKSGRDAETAAGSLSKGSQTSSKSLAEVAKQSDRASSSMTSLSNVARRAGGIIAAALSTRALVNYADSWTNMTSRVELSIGAHEDASAVMGQLADISRQTYATMESTTEAFARNSFTLRALGKSTQEQINFTAALNNALAVSGAEGERALMVQNSLSRAMAEGTLRGEDLNNVLNSGSRVAELLADSLGINVTQLRAVAADGQITSAVIYDSLVGAMEELARESEGMGPTIRGSMRLMSNAVLQAVGLLNSMYEVSGSVARQIVRLADAIDGIDWSTHAGWISATAGATGALAAAYGTAAVASGVLTTATRLLNTVMRANPMVLAASAAVALGGALYGARNATLEFGDTTASLMDWMRGAWLATGEVVGNAMGGALEASEGYWKSFVGYLGWAWDWMGTTFAALMTTIGDAVKQGVNWQIGLFLSVGDTVEILANAMIDAFKGAFQNILNIGKGFWESLTQIIQGNLDFEPFNAALRGAFVEPMKSALSEIGTAVSENMSTDHIGNAIEIVSDSVTKFGEATSDYAFQSSMMRVEVDGAVDSLEDLGETIPPIINSTARAARATDDLANSYQSLRDRLRPLEAGQRKYAQEKATLVAWALRENMATSELQGLLRDLERDYRNAGDAAEEYGFTGKQALEDSAYDFRTWEEVATSTIGRVDSAGQDLWLGFIDGSRSALDTVKRFFQQTLAEIAHMLTTQRLTVAVAGSLGLGGSGSAMGGDGGGFSGMGGMLSTGRNVWNAAQQGFGNIAWTGAQPAINPALGMQGGVSSSALTGANAAVGGANPGFMGGSTANFQGMQGLASAGAGFAGGWAGNQVFGSSEHGGTLSAIGGTIGAYWGPIGSAIGSFIGSGLGSLFGSSKTPFSGRFGTREAGAGGFEHLGNEEREGQFYRDSALGRVGFFDRGTERLQRAGTGSKDWADELSAAAAEMDNLVASLAQSEDELNAMRETVQGMAVSSRNANDIIQFALVDRPQAALEQIGGRFGDFVRSLEGGIEEVATTALIARDALALLESSQVRLNLTFESAADGAYSASFAIAELAGGLDNLSALQSSYYQAFFDDAERAVHLQEDLTQALAELGMQLPANRDGFRALVEAQDLNSEAGQRNYVALLQLAGGFDQLQQVVESLGGALSGVDLSGVRAAYEQLQSSIAAEQEILRNAHQATTRSIRDNMRTVQTAMRDTERVASSLRSTLDGMMRAGLGLEPARAQSQAYLRSVLASGGLGDPRELERALQIVAEPSEHLFSNFEDYQRDFWRTANVVSELEERAGDQLSVEQRSLQALERQLSQADRQFEQEMARLDGVLERQTAMLEAEFGQLDWLQTINGSVLSMSDAIAALGGAIRSAQAARQASQASQASSDANSDRAFAEWIRTPGAEEYYEFRTGSLPRFATGGIASGPMSGYPVELHGTEAVIPLNGSSIPLNVPGIQALVREVSELRRELAASQRAIAENSGKAARVLEREEMERRQEEFV